MGSSGKTIRETKEQEAEQYREAAEAALDQLQWCVAYLHGIRKVEISRALAVNRSHIRTQLMQESDQPLPAEQTQQE